MCSQFLVLLHQAIKSLKGYDISSLPLGIISYRLCCHVYLHSVLWTVRCASYRKMSMCFIRSSCHEEAFNKIYSLCIIISCHICSDGIGMQCDVTVSLLYILLLLITTARTAETFRNDVAKPINCYCSVLNRK